MADDLVPIGVRIALRNAVGGWGPYTVREISDLFIGHGFTDYNGEVEDAGGARRTEAEAFQSRIDFADPDAARRYLELVDEVLEEYPEEAETPDPVGIRLRQALRRAGTRSADGRLSLPGAANEAAHELEDATRGVWTPDRIRVFVSHTSGHRHEVGALAAELDRYAFSCFVAHDAIEPIRQWQEVIELALGTCDVLLAYVTNDFPASQWTDQEVGWALGRDVVVVPLSVERNPYGFFGAYQALRVAPDSPSRDLAIATTRAIAIAIFRKQRLGAERLVAHMTDLVVNAFCSSNSFETTRRRYELLALIPRSAWRPEHFETLRAACTENGQVREAVIQTPEPTPAPDLIEHLINQVR